VKHRISFNIYNIICYDKQEDKQYNFVSKQGKQKVHRTYKNAFKRLLGTIQTETAKYKAITKMSQFRFRNIRLCGQKYRSMGLL